MTTALDLITGAAKLIGVLFKSETMSDDEAADGLVSLNDMLGSWSNNGLVIISRAWESFPISGASSYLIGPGQTLNTVRPVVIRSAYIRSGSIDYPMEQITDEQYQTITLKSTSSPFPDFFNYDNAYPYGTIRFYPQLSPSGELHLLSEKPLTSIASLATTVDLPAGWNKAIRYSLAVEMAPEYGVSVSEEVARGAMNSLAAIELAVAKNRPMKFLPKTIGKPNIYNGYYR